MSTFPRLDASCWAVARTALMQADSALATWIERVGEPELPATSSHFRSLVRAILAQQLSNAAARTVCERTLALCANPRAPQPAEFLQLTEEALRTTGVSRPKIRALQALASAFHDGHLARCAFHRLPDAVILEKLCLVKGIGPWTAQMFLLFSLRRADVWAPGDLALVAGVRRIAEDPALDAAGAAEYAQRWQPWRSLAALYCWRIAHWRV